MGNFVDEGTLIQDVSIHPLKQIEDERGMVMHMLRSDSSHFTEFGEVYFSITYQNVVKAWKKHYRMSQNIVVPIGQIKLVLYDARSDSSTYDRLQEIYTGYENYNLICIPPEIWYGFQAIGTQNAIIANCTDMVHDSAEVARLDQNNSLIPYNW